MRLTEGEKFEQNSDKSGVRTKGWGNLPYPVIHAIAKIGLHYWYCRFFVS